MKFLINTLSRYHVSMFKPSTIIGLRSMSSQQNKVDFEPYFHEGARIIIPISFARYMANEDISIKKAKEYDSFLDTVFKRTAYLLQSNLISQVDILSTGGLQRINWSDLMAEKVEQHFLNTHSAILSKQSNVYTFDEWINRRGRTAFEVRYSEIASESTEGSDWYDLMLRTQCSLKEKISIERSAERSLEYQRIEYALISLMNEYTHLVYAGPMSIAWAYLYQKYDGLPVFSQVKVKSRDSEIAYLKSYDAEQTTRLLLSMITQILTNESFPPDRKEMLVNSSMSLFYAYGGLRNKTSLKKDSALDDLASKNDNACPKP